MVLAIIFTVAMVLFGYTLMTFDIPGSILTAALLSSLYLQLQQETENK